MIFMMIVVVFFNCVELRPCFASSSSSVEQRGLDGPLHLCDRLDDGAVAAPFAAPAAAPRRPQHGRHQGPQVAAAVRAVGALQRAENTVKSA